MAPSWQLPSPRLRASIARSGFVGTVSLLAATTLVARVYGAGAGYAIESATLFVAAMIVAGGHAHGRHPFHRFGPANQVTTARLALVCAVAALAGEAKAAPTAADGFAWMVAVMAIAVAVLDGVDGRLARNTGMSSAFGARFDMETDALLIMALSVLAWEWGKADAWILLAGLMRYLFVAASYVWPWLGGELFVSVRRKTICVLQIMGLTALLLPFVQPPQSTWLAIALVVTLGYSFLADSIWLWQRD